MPVRITWLFYPVLIVFSIVATGNHFWMDAVLGATTAVIALGAAWLIEAGTRTLPDSARVRTAPRAPVSGDHSLP